MPLVNGTVDEAPAATVLVQKCFESQAFMSFQNAVDHVLLAATIVATVFNILVIACGIKLFKRTDDTLRLFVICMTFGDLLLTVFSLPHELIARRYPVIRSVNLCSAVQFTYWLGIAISGLALTLLNIDKLIYFRWPLKYLMMSKEHAAYLCLAAIGMSLG
ncbi:Protein AEXR-1 [Aphelenchoides avenae]|nr:Protein AEXR-1 [Aphelenchus avenae]